MKKRKKYAMIPILGIPLMVLYFIFIYKVPVPVNIPAKNTIDKKILLTAKSMYKEDLGEFYDSLPNELPVPSDFVEEGIGDSTTIEEAIAGYVLLPRDSAFGLAAKYILDKKPSGEILFKDNAGELNTVTVTNDSHSMYLLVYRTRVWSNYKFTYGDELIFSKRIPALDEPMQ